MLFGAAVGVGLESLQECQVASQVLLLSVLLDDLFELGDALSECKVTTSLV